MLDKLLENEPVPGVDARLVQVVRIIVEDFDRDVEAFVESIRFRAKIIPGSEASQPTATRRSDRGFKP
jgi:hypothetical protein